MTQARDKANIPVLNFASKGIDDNADATAITIDSSENVGIKNTTPSNFNASARQLVVGSGSGDNGITIFAGTTNNSSLFLADGTTATNGYRGSINYLHNGDALTLHANATETMRLTNGKVGIGTSAPSNVLHIVSTDATTVLQRTTDVGNNSTLSAFNFKNSNSTVSAIANFNKSGSTKNAGADGYELRLSNFGDGYTSFFNDGSERMRIDSSGNVGIGTASPVAPLTVASGSVTGAISLGGDVSSSGITNNTRKLGRLVTPSYSTAEEPVGIILADFDASNNQIVIGGGGGDLNACTKILFNTAVNNTTTGGTERMRIHGDGNISFNTTNTSPGSGNTDTGCAINLADVVIGSRAAGASGLFNRNGDGEVIRIQESGNLEGNITVSGSTVSYNGFTGTHWSRFQDNSTPTILKGTVLETLDEMCDWYNLKFDVITQDEDGNDVTNTYKQSVPHILQDGQSVGDIITYNHNGTDVQSTIVKETDIKHVKSKVSDNSDAKNVYGVFIAYDLDGEGYNDFIVASVGTFVVRIKSGETLAKGDLLQSNGDGTAKVQSDDNIKSSSFAKVLSTTIIETYEDGSYLVPCSLMC